MAPGGVASSAPCGLILNCRLVHLMAGRGSKNVSGILGLQLVPHHFPCILLSHSKSQGQPRFQEEKWAPSLKGLATKSLCKEPSYRERNPGHFANRKLT